MMSICSQFCREEGPYPIFSQKKRKVSFVLHEYLRGVELIIFKVCMEAKAAIRSPSNPVISFSKKLLSEWVSDAVCMEEARKIAHRFFDREIRFSQFTPESSIDYWRDEFSRSTVQYLHEAVGYKRCEAPLVFTEADIARFGLIPSLVTQKPLEMSCFAYALFYVGELEARDYIFKQVEVCDRPNLFNLLSGLDYFPVANPSKGDLVVYVNSNGKANHMGVFVEGDLVHAKPGDRARFAYTHKIFDVEFEYGNRVIFFRKGPGLN